MDMHPDPTPDDHITDALDDLTQYVQRILQADSRWFTVDQRIATNPAMEQVVSEDATGSRYALVAAMRLQELVAHLHQQASEQVEDAICRATDEAPKYVHDAAGQRIAGPISHIKALWGHTEQTLTKVRKRHAARMQQVAASR